jgi:hypothetical protein
MMSDAKKAQIKIGKKSAVLAAVHSVLTSPVPSFGLPPGVRVQTNSSAVARFPLPLTIGSALLLAIGAIATMRGHRVIGLGIVGIGLLGVGTAAAAPELSSAIKKSVGASL